MMAKIVCYSVAGFTDVQKSKFKREVYGYKDISNNGKYVYRRKGLIDSIKNKKIFNGVILTNKEGSRLLVKVFRKHGVKNRVFDVVLTKKL